jgi:predicted membrane channel-forming protein YqfA (hemolysin III family)
VLEVRAVLGFATWLALLAAAGITFPRRPVVSGFLFIALGVCSMVLRYATANPMVPPPAPVLLGAGAIWFAIGVRQILRHEHP